MTLIITLKSYLASLEKEEHFKPETERREVPTVTALAREAEISRAQLHKIMANDTKSLKFDVGDRIIRAIRYRGFDMQISDLLEYRD